MAVVMQQGERISLSEQVVNFESMLEGLRNEIGEGFERYMEKAVAVLVFGSNDYINNYLMPSLYSSSYNYNPQAYADLLIQRYTRQILVSRISPAIRTPQDPLMRTWQQTIDYF